MATTDPTKRTTDTTNTTIENGSAKDTDKTTPETIGSRSNRDNSWSAGGDGLEDLERRRNPLGHADTSPSLELLEIIRDTLGFNTRLRINPPGEFDRLTASTFQRRWQGYDTHIHIQKTLLSGWTVTVDGDTIAENESRFAAFRTAAQQMRSRFETVSTEMRLESARDTTDR